MMETYVCLGLVSECRCPQDPSRACAEEIYNTLLPGGVANGVTLLFTPFGTQFGIMWEEVEGPVTLQMGRRKKTRAEPPPRPILMLAWLRGRRTFAAKCHGTDE